MNEGEEIDYNNSSYRYLGLSTDIKSGASKNFSLRTEGGENIEIAVFNLDGTLHAISNSCMHKGGPLSKGFLDGDVITCPWHDGNTL